VKAIADTGFIVAFLNRRDAHHEWALQLATQVDEPVLTCEAVIAEATFHVGDARVVLALIDAGLLAFGFNADAHLPHLKTLASRYGDRRPDFADLCVVRMSELYPKHQVITVDREDFRVYRRNKREMIPLICPPES
jgi:uncharacterized protein